MHSGSCRHWQHRVSEKTHLSPSIQHAHMGTSRRFNWLQIPSTLTSTHIEAGTLFDVSVSASSVSSQPEAPLSVYSLLESGFPSLLHHRVAQQMWISSDVSFETWGFCRFIFISQTGSLKKVGWSRLETFLFNSLIVGAESGSPGPAPKDAAGGRFRILWAPLSSSLSPYGCIYISPSHAHHVCVLVFSFFFFFFGVVEMSFLLLLFFFFFISHAETHTQQKNATACGLVSPQNAPSSICRHIWERSTLSPPEKCCVRRWVRSLSELFFSLSFHPAPSRSIYVRPS